MTEINTPPPTRAKLEILLENGRNNPDQAQDFNLLVEDLIKRHKMDFFVVKDERGYAWLKPKFTTGELHLQKFITVESETIKMKERASRMAPTEYEVLITGETGTGKEIIAKSMIAGRTGPIKALNCAGFPETLVESELFGYVRGAFTGADKDRNGLMMEAKDGVLFLDEIGELPMVVQAKLLRCLQEKTVRKVGGHREEEINCKFVFATHRNLRDMVDKGTFRKDLYARISTLELDIKPLKLGRLCDVVPITESLQGGTAFLVKHKDSLVNGTFDLSLNVRSLQQHVIRFNVFGEVSL